MRTEQWRFSLALSPYISLREEVEKATGVNDNVVVSMFPGIEVQLGHTEVAFRGLPLDGVVPSGVAAAYSPYKSLRHQHLQGVINLNWGGEDALKRWEIWDLKGRKWVLWARFGDMVWLPPGFHHQVTSFGGDVLVYCAGF